MPGQLDQSGPARHGELFGSRVPEKEIIIDVPVALSFVTTGFIWPFSAFKEFTSGKLIVPADEITVSPR